MSLSLTLLQGGKCKSFSQSTDVVCGYGMSTNHDVCGTISYQQSPYDPRNWGSLTTKMNVGFKICVKWCEPPWWANKLMHF